MTRRRRPFPWFLLWVLCVGLWAAEAVTTEPLTLPESQRPEWLAREGIVMAGSWEPLPFRVRRDGSDGYEPTPEQRAAYAREHSPEMVARLKELGVNFVMMHCYKGAGLDMERETMADAVQFAMLCHDAGLHVGVYAYSGAFLWEPFFKEKPEAEDWVILDANHKPIPYGKNAAYRYYWNRNHPGAQDFYRQIVKFAVDDIRTDLVHFDNYVVGPGNDACSIAGFRVFLGKTFTAEQLTEMGVTDINAVEQPEGGEKGGLLRRAWKRYSCDALADSYYDMGRYARSLRSDVLVECNPGGVGGAIRTPIDHGLLLGGGEAFWDEGRRPGYHDGQLGTRIRTFKVARRMNNIAFSYTKSPLEAAEAMAFNRDCLGCICWFEYGGKLLEGPGSAVPVAAKLDPYVRFFHERRDLLSGAAVVADVAVLRSFPSQVFGPPEEGQLTDRVEQALIENPTCFQIIYDEHVGELARYRALVLAGCVALSNAQIQHIKDYVAGGGKLCIVGPAATHDEWMRPRDIPVFDDVPEACAVCIPSDGGVVEAVRQACDGKPSLSLVGTSSGLTGLCAELTEQPERRLLHLVNYHEDVPAKDVAATLRLPPGRNAKQVVLASPEHMADVPVPFTQEDRTVTFTIPEVAVYEIAVVSLE